MKITIILVFLFSTLNAQEKWIGIGYQKNINESWKIKMITISEKNYEITYPDIPCSSIWIVRGRNKKNILLEEKIIDGIENCVDNGFVILEKVDDKTMKFYCFINMKDEEPYAYGLLNKEE